MRELVMRHLVARVPPSAVPGMIAATVLAVVPWAPEESLKVPAVRHAAASDAARPCWYQERQRGAAGSGVVSAARWRQPQTQRWRIRPRQRPNAESTGRCALRTAPRASRHCERAAVKRHAAASAAARLTRRKERQRSDAGRGAVSAARRRPPAERRRPHRRPHTQSASRRVLRTAPRGHAAATKERRPSVTPPRARRHDRGGARSASAAPQAAAQRAPRDGNRPKRGSDLANDHTQRARAAEHYALRRRRATAAEERRLSVTPPRSRRHDGGGARSASAAPQAAAPRAPRDGNRP